MEQIEFVNLLHFKIKFKQNVFVMKDLKIDNDINGKFINKSISTKKTKFVLKIKCDRYSKPPNDNTNKMNCPHDACDLSHEMSLLI